MSSIIMSNNNNKGRWWMAWSKRKCSASSSNETGEHSQWLCHDDGTINVVCIINLLFIIKQTAIIKYSVKVHDNMNK